jgi:hypothetical protein
MAGPSSVCKHLFYSSHKLADKHAPAGTRTLMLMVVTEDENAAKMTYRFELATGMKCGFWKMSFTSQLFASRVALAIRLNVVDS